MIFLCSEMEKEEDEKLFDVFFKFEFFFIG